MQKLFNTYWLLIAAFVYLIPSFFLPGILDVKLFETVGIKILERTDFYAFDRPTHATFPFLPLLVWPYALFHFLARLTGVEFVVFVRLMVIVFVFGMVFFLPKPTRKLFLFNPIIFMTVALHGQADMIVIFFTLLSVHFANIKKGFLSGFFMAISMFVKNWSVIFLPLMLVKVKNKLLWILGFLGTAGVLLGVYIRLLHSNLTFIFEAFFSHAGGAPGYWGLTGILNLFGFPSSRVFDLSMFILVITFGLLYFWVFLKKLDLKLSMLLLVLGFLVVTPGWGIQYAAWPIPFALFANQRHKLKIYTVIGTFYVLASYLQTYAYQFNLFVDFLRIMNKFSIILGIPLWFFTIYWLASLIYNSADGKDN